MKGNRPLRRALRRAQRFADFSGRTQVVRYERLSHTYRIVDRASFRDADTTRILTPKDGAE